MKRPVKHFAIPQRATCRRCVQSFVYGRTTKPRSYCETCLPLEKQDSNDFVNAKARAQRLAARMNAWFAHEVANA